MSVRGPKSECSVRPRPHGGEEFAGVTTLSGTATSARRVATFTNASRRLTLKIKSGFSDNYSSSIRGVLALFSLCFCFGVDCD